MNSFFHPLFLSFNLCDNESKKYNSLNDTIQFINWFYNFIFFVVGSKGEAKKQLNSLYSKVLKYHDKTRGGDDFNNWMIRILMNQLNDHFTENNLRFEILNDDELNSIFQLNQNDLKNIKEKLLLVTEDEFLSSLNRLKPEWKIALLFKDLSNFQYEEISSFTDVPENTVLFRIYCARKYLFTKLSKWKSNSNKLNQKNMEYAAQVSIIKNSETNDNPQAENSSLGEVSSEIEIQKIIANLMKKVCKEKIVPKFLESRIKKKIQKSIK